MALDELRRRIEHGARAEAAGIEKEAEAQAARAIDEAREMAAAMKRKAHESAMEEAGFKKKDAHVELEDEIESMLAAAREEAVEGQLGEVVEAVKAKLEQRERDIIKSAIAEFLRTAHMGQAVVKINGKNDDLVGKSVAKVEHANIKGVSVSSLDGKITADATVEGLAEANADAIKRELAAALFG